MSHIYVIRHAATTGQEPDAPLTPDGIRQASALAEALAGIRIARVVSSPYRRAVDTAQPLATRLGVPVSLDYRLSERVLSPVPLVDWRDRLRASFDDFDMRLPGGETSREAMWRAEAAWADVMAPGTPAAVVTHGNLMTLLLRSLDPRWGFDAWANLESPDVYLAERSLAGWKLERVNWRV
jgi:2,3-bisphosphoglycerate-dependent phosphoglycerate mutase